MGVAVHHQQVRTAAFRAQGCSLLDAETVLLVHYRQFEIGESYWVFDQGVRTDHQFDRPVRQAAANLLVFLLLALHQSSIGFVPLPALLEGCQAHLRHPRLRWSSQQFYQALIVLSARMLVGAIKAAVLLHVSPWRSPVPQRRFARATSPWISRFIARQRLKVVAYIVDGYLLSAGEYT